MMYHMNGLLQMWIKKRMQYRNYSYNVHGTMECYFDSYYITISNKLPSHSVASAVIDVYSANTSDNQKRNPIAVLFLAHESTHIYHFINHMERLGIELINRR